MRRTTPDDDEPRASVRHRPVPLDLAALADPEHDAFGAEWDKFFEGYYERLMGFFEHTVPGADDRDDLVQNIFVRAYKAIAISGSGLQSAGAAWSWLTKIGKNLLRDGYDHADATERAIDAHTRYTTIEDELRQHADDMLERLAAADGVDVEEWPIDPITLADRLSQLSDDERLLLRLRFVEDLEWQAVADRMGLKVNAVRQRFSRIAKFLRNG